MANKRKSGQGQKANKSGQKLENSFEKNLLQYMPVYKSNKFNTNCIWKSNLINKPESGIFAVNQYPYKKIRNKFADEISKKKSWSYGDYRIISPQLTAHVELRNQFSSGSVDEKELVLTAYRWDVDLRVICLNGNGFKIGTKEAMQFDIDFMARHPDFVGRKVHFFADVESCWNFIDESFGLSELPLP